ncbi:MAG: hypothetical protein K0V04_12305 [Deltaproteobacteria bacterium]|nr:hypothetical protein [Deltaproteobacteria bacterium]
MKYWSLVVVSVALAVAGAAACTIDQDVGSLTGAGSSSTSGGTTSGDPGETVSEETRSDKLDLATMDLPGEECASVMQTTTIEERPADIVVVVDHAVSNAQHAATFENFSLLIANEDIEDAQVVMLAGYPSGGGGVCIQQPPLGTGQCPLDDDNPPTYLHVDEQIQASTLLSQVLESYPQWASSMRPQAWKHIWVMSSADATMPTAQFLAELLALDEGFAQLTVHAMVPNGPGGGCTSVLPGTPVGPADAYIDLAASTGGVFEPLCDYNVKTLFESLLERIQSTALSCSYEIPPPPPGHVFDQDRVNVDYDDGTGFNTVGYVPSAADCSMVGEGWYYDDEAAPTTILMCPATCARFSQLQQASIDIRFGCATVPAG